VQFVYGALDTTIKPSITSITGTSTIVITGTNFSPNADNQVWFTKAGTNTTGDPVKVTGLAAVNGQITVVAPPEAGPGDLLVKNEKNGHKGLSAAWPIDPTAPPPCGVVTSYCTAGTTSNLCNATMSGVGTPSVSNASSFVVTASGVEGNKQGLIFYGTSGRNSAPWGLGNSFLCLNAPTQRTPTQSSGGSNGNCNGSLSLDWNAFVAANPNKAINQGLAPGVKVQVQAWFRDPPAPKTTSLSDAIEFDLCP
jgi:hypothetical protein